ncbi:MAG: winged helix-turn-helix transcriptional regulator [Clostridiales bacterium]|nr:winged helix-turn-helix transcriptional regulator [Clostridiales bacterium]
MNRLLKISERNKSEMLGLLPSEACSSKLALYFQNFADQTRIKILSALAIQELCVNDLSKILNINQTTISHQLKTLKDQEIVDYTREGKILIYRLKSPLFNEMMEYAASMI